MNIIAVDDERRALRSLEDALAGVMPGAEVHGFLSAAEALEYVRGASVDIAFLDIKLAEMNGLILAKNIKDLHGKANIIFVTGYSDYAVDAIRLRASGYLMKPVDPEQLRQELADLRNPVDLLDRGIRVQCFGSFEVFVDGRPVSFNRARAKEVLAYLVDRQGARASNKEIAAILWENEPYDRSKQKQLDTIINEMLRALKEVDARQMILKNRGQYAVDKSTFVCDLYLYEQGDAEAVNRYHGKYMENYSWAEFTAGRLADL